MNPIAHLPKSPYWMASALFSMALACAHAQDRAPAEAATAPAEASTTDDAPEKYTPVVGQSGKDVVWVPTGEPLVDRMLKMAEITPQDYLVDLGSGDGRTVVTAAQRGTRAHGIEFNPDLVALSRKAAEEADVADKATFAEGDIFESDFSDATVVTLFLLPELNLRLRPILLDMKPGTRVVSNSFTMGDWQPDDAQEAGPECQSYCRAYKWIVPAKVAGTWKLDNDATLELDQTYQMLTGRYAAGGQTHEISDAAMQGARIHFTVDGQAHEGEVDGNRMSGRDASGKAWSATRGE